MTAEYSDFEPRKYLEEYYTEVGPENKFLLDVLAAAYGSFEPDSITVLEIGGGPTIYQDISAAKAAKEIHFTDIAEQNLDEVRTWVENESGAFNWKIFFDEALDSEGITSSPTVVEERAELLRSRLTKMFVHNILEDSPLSDGYDSYDIVSSIFASDAITRSVGQWSELIDNILKLLKVGGHLMLVGVLGSDEWKMGDQTYKATNLDEKVIKSELSKKRLDIELFRTIVAEGGQGYDAVFFVKARKIPDTKQNEASQAKQKGSSE